MYYLSYSEIRAKARENLTNNWPLAIGIGLLSGTAGFTFRYTVESDTMPMFFLVFLPLLVLAVCLLAAIGMGERNFHLVMNDTKHGNFSDFLDGFKFWKQGVLAALLIGLYTFLWSLLLFIPGIIKSYAYSQTFYILLENKNMPINEAIKHSERIMDGHKMRYFVLQLTFFGWVLVSFLTCGLGFLALGPYMEQSNTVFYRELVSHDPILGKKRQYTFEEDYVVGPIDE